MRHLILLGAICICSGLSAQDKWSKEKELAFYKQGLHAPNSRIRGACVYALKAFPENYAIMKEILETMNDSEVLYAATNNLSSLGLTEKQGKELFALYLTLNKDKDKRRVAGSLMGILVKKFPKRLCYYGLLNHVKYIRRSPDLRDDMIKEIEASLPHLPKNHQYRLVPALCDALLKSWSPYKSKVLALLVKITGKTNTLPSKITENQLYELVDEYRTIYYSKLKSKVAKIDTKFLDDPFGAELPKSK
jgi:hypothetical protein